MPVSQKSIQNLKPPKKGEIRNPKGRGNSLSAKVIIRKWLESYESKKNPLTNKVEVNTVLDNITLAVIVKANKGDVNAFNALLDRTEGKAKQEIQHEGKVQYTLTIKEDAACEPIND